MTVHLHFWGRSRQVAVETTDLYVKAFTARLLPIVDRVEEEAAEDTHRAWQSAASGPPVDEMFDPSMYAEAAQEYSLEVYENLQFVRQQLLGLATAGLYHLWERLLRQFLCKELRTWSFDGRDIRALMAKADFRDLERFLGKFNFQLADQPYYGDLCELRLVANVAKHGDGAACEELQQAAPQLFAGYKYHFDIFSKADTLELSPANFATYTRAITTFWESFPEHLSMASA